MAISQITADSLAPGAVTVTSSMMPAGSIIQIANTEYANTASVSIPANTQTNVSGLSVTITPTSANSSFLIFVRWCGEFSGDGPWNAMWRVLRNGTAIGMPLNYGSRNAGIMPSAISYQADYTSTMESVFFQVYDSPATSNAVTYQIAIYNGLSAQTLYTNRTVADSDSNQYERGTCNVTVMEIAG